MRIIGGSYRAKKLNAPHTNHIRPTTDRMRETLFNMLDHGTGPGLRHANVLDLFAGTGALGIEALSRGAKHVTFVDNDRRSLKLIEQNLKEIKKPENVTLLAQNASSFKTGAFDVIFVDPPYRKGFIESTLLNIVENDLLNKDGIIMIEYASNEQPGIPEILEDVKSRKMGDARFSLIMKRD